MTLSADHRRLADHITAALDRLRAADRLDAITEKLLTEVRDHLDASANRDDYDDARRLIAAWTLGTAERAYLVTPGSVDRLLAHALARQPAGDVERELRGAANVIRTPGRNTRRGSAA